MATAREQLATLLRQARIDAGFDSHAALARKLNVTRSVITKAENPGHPVPSDAILAAWAGATGVGLDVLVDLAQRARSGTPDWFMPYRQAEAEATVLRCWSPVLVPGVLQVKNYMRAVLSVEPYTASQLDDLIAARLGRQDVIGRARLTAIIDQHVLGWLIGTPTIMAEQCAHLASLAEHPDVAVHVTAEGTNVGLWGAFDLAARDGTITVRLSALEDVTSTAPNLVDKALRAWEQILGAALPRADSLGMIRLAEEQWKSRI